MSEDPTPPDIDEYRSRQRGRNRVLGLMLGFFAILFFAITIVRMKQGG